MRSLRKQAIWSLLFLLPCLVCLALFILTKPSSAGPGIDLTFICYTNQGAARLALFSVTNQNPHLLRYGYAVEQKTSAGWPVYSGPMPLEWVFGDAPPRRGFLIRTAVPTGSNSWRLIITVSRLDVTRLDRTRGRIAQWFWDRQYNTVGELFHNSKGWLIPGPEMNEKTGPQLTTPLHSTRHDVSAPCFTSLPPRE
jgi:hypothetical protein